MDFLNPRVLGEEGFFRQRYRLPIERYGDMSSLRDLKARVGPFILRRLKTDRSIISTCRRRWSCASGWGSPRAGEALSQNRRRQPRHHRPRPLGQRHGQVLALLTKLKQICNHPALALKEEPVDNGFATRSAKLLRLEEILKEVIEAGDRALLFTQFAEWGHLLKVYLEKRWRQDVPFLHGGSSKTDRQAMVDR